MEAVERGDGGKKEIGKTVPPEKSRSSSASAQLFREEDDA
jgi:hypothetical protein